MKISGRKRLVSIYTFLGFWQILDVNNKYLDFSINNFDFLKKLKLLKYNLINFVGDKNLIVCSKGKVPGT